MSARDLDKMECEDCGGRFIPAVMGYPLYADDDAEGYALAPHTIENCQRRQIVHLSLRIVAIVEQAAAEVASVDDAAVRRASNVYTGSASEASAVAAARVRALASKDQREAIEALLLAERKKGANLGRKFDQEQWIASVQAAREEGRRGVVAEIAESLRLFDESYTLGYPDRVSLLASRLRQLVGG